MLSHFVKEDNKNVVPCGYDSVFVPFNSSFVPFPCGYDSVFVPVTSGKMALVADLHGLKT
jgi:hypothetical protein